MRRGRFEIMSDILSIVRGPSTKTKIVYEANLSFAQAERYLNSLLENNLIKSLENKNTEYEITEKGREFLENCKELKSLLSKGEKTNSALSDFSIVTPLSREEEHVI